MSVTVTYTTEARQNRSAKGFGRAFQQDFATLEEAMSASWPEEAVLARIEVADGYRYREKDSGWEHVLELRLAGRMWWNDPAGAEEVQLAALRRDSFQFAVRADGGCYEGTLNRRGDTNHYAGNFAFVGKQAGTAECTLSEDAGKYGLTGSWHQNGRSLRWAGELERE